MGYELDLYTYYGEPTLSPLITDDVKLLITDTSFGNSGGAVTFNNHILVCGDEIEDYISDYDPSVQYIRDMTDNLPSNKNIINVQGGYGGFLVLMDDGTVYGRGGSYEIGTGYYGEDSYDQ
jgi:hypothetical protein